VVLRVVISTRGALAWKSVQGGFWRENFKLRCVIFSGILSAFWGICALFDETDGAEELGRLDSNRFFEVVEKMDDLHQEGICLLLGL